MISHARLLAVLRYVKSTGLFYWKVSPKYGIPAGAVAGGLSTKGYVLIGVDGRLYRAHRLAWFYVTGHWPAQLLDHRNTLKSDNRWVNLRDADERLNRENRRTALAKNKVGLLGVSKPKASSGWTAQIKSQGVVHYLGTHPTPKQAHRAYLKAKRSLHAGCTI